MKNYRITVQYDGTRYRGWQVQKSTDATIQGKLEHVLSTLAGHPVEVIGSGRTDAGVRWDRWRIFISMTIFPGRNSWRL